MNKALCTFGLLILVMMSTSGREKTESASVEGRVTNLSGFSIPGIRVRFYLLLFEKGIIVSAEGRLIDTAITDESGYYKLGGLPPGQYRVVIAEPGFAEVDMWRVSLPRGVKKELDIGVPTETHGLTVFSVTGRVEQIDKTPLEDATVTVVNAFNHDEMWQTRSDKNGLYKITLIQAGQYLVYTSKPGFQVSVVSVYLPTEKSINFVSTPLRMK
jgi:hypothetical protein